LSTRNRRDIGALLEDRSVLDRAMKAAAADAVRRHRQAGVPMAMWRDGRVVHVSPFEVRLPGEDPAG
jgi:hypothetical protein